MVEGFRWFLAKKRIVASVHSHRGLFRSRILDNCGEPREDGVSRVLVAEMTGVVLCSEEPSGA